MKQILFILSILILISGCSIKEETAVITVSQKDGLIDNSGKVMVKPIYKKIYNLDSINHNTYSHPHYINLHWIHIADEKFAIVRNVDNKFGIIDRNGNLKLKVIFDSIDTFFNGYAKVEVDKKFGLIDENFEIVLKPIYDDVRNVLDESVIVKNYDKNKRTKYGCLNINMDMVLSLDYDMIYLSHENRMRVVKDNKWGFLDTKCNIIADAIYDFVDDYSKEIARVQKGKLWTYLDYDGKELNRKTFNDVDNF